MVREVELTQGKVALVDDADYARVRQRKWSYVSKGTGTGYAAHFWRKDGRGHSIGMHRFLLDAPAHLQVDHINGDGLDNRRENLRLCTQTENMRNRKALRNNRSGFKGVTRKRDRYEAYIRHDEKAQEFLGGYDNPYSAALAYDRAAVEHHGEFAALNFDPMRDWIIPYPVEGLRERQRALRTREEVILWPPAPSQMERAA